MEVLRVGAQRSWPRVAAPYLAASICASATVAVTAAAQDVFDGIFFAIPLASASLIALALGLGPGVVAAAILLAGVWLLLVGPSVTVHGHDVSNLARFAAMAIALVPIVTVAGRQRLIKSSLDRQRRAASEAAARIEAILSSISDAFVTLDSSWAFTYINRAAETLLRRSRSELLGRNLWEALPAVQGTPVEQHYRRAVAEQRPELFEWHTPTDDRWLELHAYPAEGGGLSVFFRDVTDRKRAEHALREADRRKDEFLAMLSHELRNPLAPIRNSLYLLRRTLPQDERAQRASTVIDRQVGHLTRLVEDLLDVTRISRGKTRLQRAPLELGELLRRTTEDYRSVFTDHGLALSVNLPCDRLWVDGDATRLAQVVGNLLQNSAKFTPRGGRVELTLGTDGTGKAVLAIEDSGMGIDPALLPHLFEPFSQAETSLDRSRGGLGLGLALVKGLVALHGGEVTAHSGGKDQGSRFVIVLPLVAEVPCLEAASPGPHAEGRRKRVLIIEDNQDAAESIRDALLLGNAEVEVAFSGPEGLAKAHEFHPEVVLCDIGLPGMDGYAGARAFRADGELQSAYLVALTGYTQPEDRRRALEAGFERHVAKPASLELLEELISHSRPAAEPPPAAVVAG